MRITQFIETLVIGGAERMVARLCLELQRRGHEVSVICFRHRGEMANDLDAAGIPVLELHKGHGFGVATAKTVWKLTQTLKELRPDVLHSHNPHIIHYAAVASKLARVPVAVNTLHGVMNVGASSWSDRLFELGNFVGTDRVVAVCEEGRDIIGEHTRIRPDSVAVIPNGVPLPGAAKAFNGSRPSFTFGIVGRLAPVKDHAMLVDAFSRVVKRFPQSRLEILGDGETRPELEAQIARLGLRDSVELCGFSLDVDSFLQRWDACVLTSRSEALPMSVLEAMAMGLPILSTAVGNLPPLLESSGGGWVSAAGDPDAFADLMIRLIESGEASEMGRKSREYIAQHYAESVMAERYVELYQRHLASAGHKLEVLEKAG